MEKTRRGLTRGTAILIIIVAGLILTAAVIIRGAPDTTPRSIQSFLDVSTQEGREKYLSSLGWEVDMSTEKSVKVIIPEQFSNVMAEYNELQKKQGFDLTSYSGLECMQYTCTVCNYPDSEDNVQATLYVLGKRVIAGDIHSTALDGFMHALS